jgi:hypothetical protein
MQAKTFLNKMTMLPMQMRTMSSTASIRDRFESAYSERVEALNNAPKKM